MLFSFSVCMHAFSHSFMCFFMLLCCRLLCCAAVLSSAALRNNCPTLFCLAFYACRCNSGLACVVIGSFFVCSGQVCFGVVFYARLIGFIDRSAVVLQCAGAYMLFVVMGSGLLLPWNSIIQVQENMPNFACQLCQ